MDANATRGDRDRYITPERLGRLVGLGLSPRQAEVFLYLFEFTAAHGHPPLMKKVAAMMGLPRMSSVECHYKALRRKGWLAARGRGFARTPSGARFRGFVPLEDSWSS